MSETAKKRKPICRGLRNNNPLNIRIGNVWLGEVNAPTDPDFEQFVSLEYGLRAAFVLFRRYINHYKRDTIQAIISAWAPPIENQTTAYIDQVSKLTGIAPDEKLMYSEKAIMCVIMSAMAYVECGQLLDEKIIAKAYDMA